jgi:hypothetical protein
MLIVVVSGGQTGVDQAAWRAAKRLGIRTGGWMPKGFLTEDGNRPELAGLYGAVEYWSASYPPRTFANARDSDCTIWVGPGDSSGFHCTKRCAGEAGRKFIHLQSMNPRFAEINARFLLGVNVLNVAGSRESKQPGIGAEAEEFLFALFSELIKTATQAEAADDATPQA